MNNRIGFSTPIVSGSIDVADKTVGIIFCFLAVGFFVAGLDMLSK